MGVQKVIVLAEVSLQCPGELHDALAGERSAMLRVCVSFPKHFLIYQDERFWRNAKYYS